MVSSSRAIVVSGLLSQRRYPTLPDRRIHVGSHELLHPRGSYRPGMGFNATKERIVFGHKGYLWCHLAAKPLGSEGPGIPGAECDVEIYPAASSDRSSESEVDRAIRKRSDSSIVSSQKDQGGLVGNENVVSDQTILPVFEYLEHDLPYEREPLAEKASAASIGLYELSAFLQSDIKYTKYCRFLYLQPNFLFLRRTGALICSHLVGSLLLGKL
ncbi:hypothetical protein MA16_Dca020721 [Dendrobium catenatum]|uniref:Uncharacterized protein n=1 Tax=Dendrobium catenatum TaxID=906689 RepID=A0A2I0WIV4_9ASPA|nr:hypothetical protein MA16_Dca020721 [Dendrobium catenatum]